MSETGKAIETLWECLRTGNVDGGGDALRRVSERLIDLVVEVSQLKRSPRVSDRLHLEEAAFLLIGSLSDAERHVRVNHWCSREIERRSAGRVFAEQPAREPDAQQGRQHAGDDGQDDAGFGGRNQ